MSEEGIIKVGWGRYWATLVGPWSIIGLITLIAVGGLIWIAVDLSPGLAAHNNRLDAVASYSTAVHEEQKGYLISLLTMTTIQHEKTLQELIKIKYILSLSERDRERFRLRMPEGLAEEVVR